jgi:SAM-dependent methyltransferase
MSKDETKADQIEKSIEAEGIGHPDYAGRKFTAKQIKAGAHRRWVGGKWESLGRLQRDFVVSQGLQPDMKFLDIACGSFRAGRLIADYLEPGNYYGVDANESLVQAGWEQELTDAQRQRIPRENLRITDRFDVDFGVRFDMALAHSLFTHLSLNAIRLCLYRLAPVMRPGAVFYATYFEQPEDFPLDGVFTPPYGGRPRFHERNVFWYHRSDIAWAAGAGRWSFEYIGDWGHPRGQVMAAFRSS